mmetsp:Transcript_17412/g.20148  ORF Transcript_17412/g.20148 Transcript_17412/m.20148 type:complete len:377 (-) Transcript_17412:63-1193(-)
MSTKTAASNPTSGSTTNERTTNSADARYACDDEQLQVLRQKSPWKEDPLYFKSVDVSPTAIMKMMTHCHSGVEKGIKNGGKPIEVMGLLLGRPDPTTPHTLVVTDAFPLPIEGFETRVIADDADVTNYMISLGESLEKTRKEKFMGWYHSHPFDVGLHSHCFLSSTDLSTQLAWQRLDDAHGNPFLAIVVDPLRSLTKNKPEIKAFRVYPPEYSSPIANQCPDGSIVEEEKERLEKWGSCWNRYYALKVEYFMSKSARNIMTILTQNFLWMRNLGSTPSLEPENRQGHPSRVTAIAENVKKIDIASLVASSGKGGNSSIDNLPSAHLSSVTSSGNPGSKGVERNESIYKACDGVIEFATEKVHENIVQVVKKDIFS